VDRSVLDGMLHGLVSVRWNAPWIGQCLVDWSVLDGMIHGLVIVRWDAPWIGHC